MSHRLAELSRMMYRPVFWVLLSLCSYFALIPSVPNQVATIDDLILHAGAFLALALSAATAYPERSLWVIGGSLSSYGAAIEALQGASGWRQADMTDLVVDILATATGLAVVALWRELRARWG